MKIAPTLQGGIRIDVESMLDWVSLEMISLDAKREDTTLGKLFAKRMPQDDDWDEYVVPDLEEEFNGQLDYVNRKVRLARSRNSEEGSLHINPADAGEWYGALNQARLALEEKFSLSDYDTCELEEIQLLKDEIRSAYIRSHFYADVQGLLLSYVMDG